MTLLVHSPLTPRLAIFALAALCVAWPPAARSFVVGITPGTRALFLQVGVGTMSGGMFNQGGVPGNNTVVNTASVTIPAAQIGSGTAQAMTTNSTVTASPFDGFAFCSTPATTGQVYVGGFYRIPGSTGSGASLTVTTPTNLTNSTGATIPFNRVAWTSSGNQDTVATIASGAFTGGTQTLLSVATNNWFESCLAFRYLNTTVVPAGTFNGRATYTLSAP